MSRRPATGPTVALVALLGLGTLTAGCARSRPRTPPVVLPQPRPPHEVLDPHDRTPDEEVERLRPPEVPPITPAEPEPVEPDSPEPEPRATSPPSVPALAVSREPGEVRRLVRETRELLARTEQAIAELEASQRERHETSVALILDLVARSQQALENDDPELAHSLAVKAQTLARDL